MRLRLSFPVIITQTYLRVAALPTEGHFHRTSGNLPGCCSCCCETGWTMTDRNCRILALVHSHRLMPVCLIAWRSLSNDVFNESRKLCQEKPEFTQHCLHRNRIGKFKLKWLTVVYLYIVGVTVARGRNTDVYESHVHHVVQAGGLNTPATVSITEKHTTQPTNHYCQVLPDILRNMLPQCFLGVV